MLDLMVERDSFLPKCNALQCLYRHIDRIRCLNATFYALFLERRRGRNAEIKSSGMMQNFWVRFSITPIHFQCFELGQQYVLN